MQISLADYSAYVTVIFCGVPVWCCFASAEIVWTVRACTFIGYHYVAYLDLGQELSGYNQLYLICCFGGISSLEFRCSLGCQCTSS